MSATNDKLANRCIVCGNALEPGEAMQATIPTRKSGTRILSPLCRRCGPGYRVHGPASDRTT